MEEVDVFRYFRVDMSADRSMKDEVNHKIGERKKMGGALKYLWKEISLFMVAKNGMYKNIMVLTLSYGCEAWVLTALVKRRLEMFECHL